MSTDDQHDDTFNGKTRDGADQHPDGIMELIRIHWPIMVVLILTAWMLGPLVNAMGPLTDDHVLLQMVHSDQSVLKNIIKQLHGNARLLEGIGLQIEYRLYDLNAQLGQVYALFLHLVNGLLLYILLLRLKMDRWLATGIVILRLTSAIQSEAIFWFACRQYLTSGALMIVALIAIFSPNWGQRASGRVSGILLLCAVMLMEQVGPMAFMLSIGLWWGWVYRGKLQWGRLYPWLLDRKSVV